MSEVIILSHMKLRMMVDKRLATIMWARKVYEDIYELSFRFDDGGYQLWYARALEEGGFSLISCSMYNSLETQAIKLKELLMKGDI